MENNLTPRMLWEYAKIHHLEDAPIRICDGMAVSYMPDRGCLGRSPQMAVIDVSTVDPVEYDELDSWALAILHDDEKRDAVG